MAREKRSNPPSPRIVPGTEARFELALKPEFTERNGADAIQRFTQVYQGAKDIIGTSVPARGMTQASLGQMLEENVLAHYRVLRVNLEEVPDRSGSYALALKPGSLPGKHRWRALAAELLDDKKLLTRGAAGHLVLDDETFGKLVEQAVLSRFQVEDVESALIDEEPEPDVIRASDPPHRSVGELEADDELMSVADNEESGLLGSPYPELDGTLLTPPAPTEDFPSPKTREGKMALVDRLLSELDEMIDWPETITEQGMLMLAELTQLPRHIIRVLLESGYVLKSQPEYPIVFEQSRTPDIEQDERIDSVTADFEVGVSVKRARRIIYEKNPFLQFKDAAYEIIRDADGKRTSADGSLQPGTYQIVRRPNLDRLRRDVDETQVPF